MSREIFKAIRQDIKDLKSIVRFQGSETNQGLAMIQLRAVVNNIENNFSDLVNQEDS